MNIQLQNAVAFLDNILTQQTAVVDEDAYNQSIISDFAASQSFGIRFARQRLSASVGAASSVLSPLMTAYAHHIVGTPEREAQRAIDRIYEFFRANAKTVKSRGITYGTPSSFGAGKGLLRRLTEDENGFDLEATFVDTKTVRCIRDENLGASRHEAVFEFRGGAGGVDTLDADSSGAVDQGKQVKTANQSLLRNSNFSSSSRAGAFAAGVYTLVAADTLTGWTLSDNTKFQLDQNSVPFSDGLVGDTTPTSLTFLLPATATQAFSVQRIQLNAAFPYLVEFWCKPDAALTVGTLRVTWGSKTQDFDLTTLVAGSWNIVALDMDADLWPASFSAADSVVSFEVLAGADAPVGLDEVFFGQLGAFDGLWYHLSPGLTKFLLDDVATAADTFAAADSKIQKWFWRAFARHLPHAAVPTLADP